MMRAHPIFSRWGCFGGLLLVVGVAAAMAASGGAIFSPGELTTVTDAAVTAQPVASHAQISNDCAQCHAPFTGVAATRCQACHTSVAEQRAAGTGLHGRLPAAEVGRCANCHSDHRGRGFDPSAEARLAFDHTLVGFSLAEHAEDFDGRPLDCARCHQQADFLFEPALCVTCHGQADTAFMAQHAAAFGTDCRACHDGVDVTDRFDHAQTEFPLESEHAGLTCAACHSPAVSPAETASQCADCHAEPAVHQAVFTGQACAGCHTPAAWSPARLEEQPAFRHAETAFQLVNHTVDFAGAAVTCVDCHSGAPVQDFTATTQTCAGCHAAAEPVFMQQHLQDFGLDCAACHDGTGNLENFDHALIFPLEGAHAAVACGACHVDQVFQGTPRECAGCHAEPPIHAGLFGTNCAACHTTSAWQPAQLVQHAFPLDHGDEGEIPCATCHTDNFTAYTCTDCHEHPAVEMVEEHADEGIVGERLLDCAACHPAGEKD